MAMTIVWDPAHHLPQKIKHIIAMYTMFSAISAHKLVRSSLIL